jgi:hypothetical protein
MEAHLLQKGQMDIVKTDEHCLSSLSSKRRFVAFGKNLR